MSLYAAAVLKAIRWERGEADSVVYLQGHFLLVQRTNQMRVNMRPLLLHEALLPVLPNTRQHARTLEFVAFEFKWHFSKIWCLFFFFMQSLNASAAYLKKMSAMAVTTTTLTLRTIMIMFCTLMPANNTRSQRVVFFSSTFPYSRFPDFLFLVQGYQVKYKHTRTSFCRGLSRSLPVFSGTSSGKTPTPQNRAGDWSMMVVWFLDVSKTTRVSYWKQTEAKTLVLLWILTEQLWQNSISFPRGDFRNVGIGLILCLDDSLFFHSGSHLHIKTMSECRWWGAELLFTLPVMVEVKMMEKFTFLSPYSSST